MNGEMNAPRGSTKIELWLAGVTDNDVEDTADAIATLLVAGGFNVEGTPRSALLAIFAAGLPEQPAEMAADLLHRGANAIMVPGDVEE